jgi:hypothetical protein
VPPTISQHFLEFEKLCELDTLACLPQHDTSLRLSAEYVSSAIESLSKRRCASQHTHDAFTDILQEYRGQWDFSDKLQQTIDRLFGDRDDARLKKLYTAFGGIESSYSVNLKSLAHP